MQTGPSGGPSDGESTEAAPLINSAVEKANSPGELLAMLRERIEGASPEVKARIEEYIAGIRGSVEGNVIEKLPANVGGLYDGSVKKMAKKTLAVKGDSDIDTTLAQADFTDRHEDYHEEHRHTEEVVNQAGTTGETVAKFGGEEFDLTTLAEGLNVIDVGDDFVTGEYKEYAAKIRRGVSSATGIELSDVRDAFNKEKTFNTEQFNQAV